ncbi:uncharacterized protein BDZ83DRAFT_653960 [Colletotrichum acutatum]|uniref:Uncharacterized protein n=1 Tax=Glomerella acutata TaxID=27357 RepID=A0AAD8XCN1_GLOAC|nr:uncharacterized protein BDZ83DRAFT_653960 [Colletotrichum acutatum]KAK1722367.1 hypothetical protein BDZ83DRAFT_653960 [Colletotrichum acutatum]
MGRHREEALTSAGWHWLAQGRADGDGLMLVVQWVSSAVYSCSCYLQIRTEVFQSRTREYSVLLSLESDSDRVTDDPLPWWPLAWRIASFFYLTSPLALRTAVDREQATCSSAQKSETFFMELALGTWGKSRKGGRTVHHTRSRCKVAEFPWVSEMGYQPLQTPPPSSIRPLCSLGAWRVLGSWSTYRKVGIVGACSALASLWVDTLHVVRRLVDGISMLAPE